MDPTLTVRDQHGRVRYTAQLRYGATVAQAKVAIGLLDHVPLYNKFGQAVPNGLAIRGNMELKINA